MKNKLLFLLVMLLPLSLFGKITVEKDVKYYDVNPKSKKDLSATLLSKSPVKIAGTKRYGGTTWSIYHRYEYKGKCRITKAFVELNIKTVLPRLEAGKNIKYSVKSPFNKFSNKLAAYQKKHVKFALQAAKDVEKKMLSYGSPSDCKAFRKQLRSDIEKIIKKYKTKSLDYDEKTDYGRKEGVKL